MKLTPLQTALFAGASSLFAGCPQAQAQALSWNPSWGLSGFGTLAYTQTSTDQGQFVNPGQSGGVTRDGGAGTDSLLGAQLNLQANNVFSATVQAIDERNDKGTYQPQVEWAFLKAQATPELAVRLGRIGLPFFMVSDYRHVNYSNLWVRPPVEVYGQVPGSHVDGGDAIYRKAFGSATVTAQVFGGRTIGQQADLPGNLGVNVSVEFDNGLTLRAGTAKAKFISKSASLQGLEATLDKTPYASVATQLAGQRASFTGFGASYDQGNWVGNVEYTFRRTDNFISDTTGWEATGGYRIGKFTPYAVIAKVKVDDANVDNTIPATPGQLAALHGAVDSILFNTNSAQHSASLGLRWDVYKNIALKAQFDRIHVANGSSGMFQKATAALAQAPVNVYALSCDFLF